MRMFPSAVVPHVFMFFGCQSTFMPYIIYSFPSFHSPQLETKASNVMQSISSSRTMRECPTDGLQTSCWRLCSLHSSELQHSSAHRVPRELPGVLFQCGMFTVPQTQTGTWHFCPGTCCSSPSWNTRDGKCYGCRERTTPHPDHKQT